MTSLNPRQTPLLALVGVTLGLSSIGNAADPTPAATPVPGVVAPAGTAIFDGKSLKDWKVTEFGGHGNVKVADGAIVLDAGNDLTGVNYTGEVPKQNYEITLEAKRLEGSDFFCAVTFPIGKANVTYVVGGWGGSVTGISSINGDDASENETTQFLKFESNRWYKIRIRVSEKKLEAWLDDQQTANVDLEDKRLSMRFGEIELSAPFGIASYQTRGAVREIRLRKLP